MAKIAVVTGASAGVGRAVAREYARCGYDVALIARGQDGLAAAQREIEACGRRALVLPADVADENAVEAAAGRVEAELGPIDVWTNVAFSNVFAELADLTAHEYRRITEVTYLGYVWGTMAALKRMLPRDRGMIVQVGSALAYRSIPLQAAYCGAKSAIRGFTDSLRCELQHHKSRVRVTMAVLPAVNTPQFSWCRSKLPRRAQPVPPIYQPELIARAVVWLASHPRRELRIGWPVVQALLVQNLAPAFGDWYLGRTGYDAQQYDGGRDPAAPDNLEQPLAGDWGAHGDFDDRATDESRQLWLTQHRRTLLSAALTGASLLVLLRRKRKER